MRCYITWIIVVLALFGAAFAALSDVAPETAVEQTTAVQLPPVSVVVDGRELGVSTAAATVAELLHQLGISLTPLDRAVPSLSHPVTPGLQVRITRVARREEVEEAIISSQTVVLADPDLPAGFTKILSHGNDGLVRRVWRIWEKDGQESSRGVLRERVITKAADTVVVRGVYNAPNRGGNWRHPRLMEATAYDPGPRSCGKYADGYTATGMKATKGVVAVDDRVIPMGTRMYIPGYGFAVAADRGSAIKGNRIDLCYDTYREAIQFGRRTVKVYLLD